jgi:tetratricopeptide (TPR) repeat protein
MTNKFALTISMLGFCLISAPITSYAQETEEQAIQDEAPQDPVMEQISYLQTEWAKIKYQIADQDTQLDSIHALEEHAAKVTAAYQDRAEPKIWEGIILSTDAGIVKGISALGKVKQAKALFEESIKQDPLALQGSAYTSLGSLYYQVPSWPIAFGDSEEAEKYLKQALKINPDGIDPNFFYADFLIQDDREAEAKPYLEHALEAGDRPGRELADAGRRQEIKAALSKLNI